MIITVYPKITMVTEGKNYMATLGDTIPQYIGFGENPEEAVQDLQKQMTALSHANLNCNGDVCADVEILNHLQSGEKIKAIKRYRELTGAGLKESMDAINAIQEASEKPPESRPDYWIRG